MVTEENARRNLATAARLVRSQLGLSDLASDWTYEQRNQYNKALAAMILTYPASFTPEILASAARVSSLTYSQLEDTSFAWGEFAAETAQNAKPVLSVALGTLLAGAIVYFIFLAGIHRPRRAHEQ
jgi:hypothetical protein